MVQHPVKSVVAAHPVEMTVRSETMMLHPPVRGILYLTSGGKFGNLLKVLQRHLRIGMLTEGNRKWVLVGEEVTLPWKILLVVYRETE